jgi:DNA adenine methylase
MNNGDDMISSPLRYPGGKAKLCYYIEKVINCNHLGGYNFYEPFAGGASVSINLLQSDMIGQATLIEKDPLIYAFWYTVFNKTAELCSMIEESKVNIETWEYLTHCKNIDIPNKENILELGFAGLFFNRTSFSGILNGGPIGGFKQDGKYKIDCRFNKEKLIKSIYFLSLYKDRVNVLLDDGVRFLDYCSHHIQGNSFFYVDPPYYNKGKSLYRRYFNNQEHINLSNILKRSQFPWLLSYDNCPFINEIYGHDNCQLNRTFLYFDYSINNVRKEQELLVSNLEIPPIETKLLSKYVS